MFPVLTFGSSVLFFQLVQSSQAWLLFVQWGTWWWKQVRRPCSSVMWSGLRTLMLIGCRMGSSSSRRFWIARCTLMEKDADCCWTLYMRTIAERTPANWAQLKVSRPKYKILSCDPIHLLISLLFAPHSHIEELTSSAKLKVKASVEPLFTRQLDILEVIEGRNARFDCKVSGTPPPQVIWTHFGMSRIPLSVLQCQHNQDRGWVVYVSNRSSTGGKRRHSDLERRRATLVDHLSCL